jgi:hypothetical protein
MKTLHISQLQIVCAVFERAVKEYVKKSNNGKCIEVTFAHAEATLPEIWDILRLRS